MIDRIEWVAMSKLEDSPNPWRVLKVIPLTCSCRPKGPLFELISKVIDRVPLCRSNDNDDRVQSQNLRLWMSTYETFAMIVYFDDASAFVYLF